MRFHRVCLPIDEQQQQVQVPEGANASAAMPQCLSVPVRQSGHLTLVEED